MISGQSILGQCQIGRCQILVEEPHLQHAGGKWQIATWRPRPTIRAIPHTRRVRTVGIRWIGAFQLALLAQGALGQFFVALWVLSDCRVDDRRHVSKACGLHNNRRFHRPGSLSRLSITWRDWTKSAYLDMSPFALKAALSGLGVTTAQWHREPLSSLNREI